MTDKDKKTSSGSGIFVVDLTSLDLSPDQLSTIEKSIQDVVQKELAKLDDSEGGIGGPLGGSIMGFRAL